MSCSLLVFQVGGQDAPTLAEQLGSPAEASDLLMLPKYQAYARILIDGQPSRPFSMRTLAPPRSSSTPAVPRLFAAFPAFREYFVPWMH
ncbi:MAG: hypothetical protein NTY19_07865 [Planctomycetota bacterium]|nr:hypothetical protein [Planctomycetota bacterium]